MAEPNEAFARRQAQWNEFHRWQRSRILTPISLSERIRGYFAAFDSSFAATRQRSLQDVATKVEAIHQARERLALLNRFE